MEGSCPNCGEELIRQCSIFLNYISELNLNLLDDFYNWQNLLNPVMIDKSIMCSSCGNISHDTSLVSFVAPTIYLVEFGGDYDIEFGQNLVLNDQNYVLRGLVRHKGAHFSCAVLDDNNWIYIDDLHEKTFCCESLRQLYEIQKDGWFFCIYIKENISDQTNFVHFEIASTLRKRKMGKDDLKDYPLRSKSKKIEEDKAEIDKRYYANNKEHINLKRKNYYKNNCDDKKNYYEKTKDKRKEYLAKTKDLQKQKRQEYFAKTKDLRKEKQKEYYEKNKDKIKAQRERNHDKTKDLRKEKQKEYYEKNKEKIKAQQRERNHDKTKDLRKEKQKEYYEKQKEYYEKNKEKIKAQQRERNHAKKRQNTEKNGDFLGDKFHKKLEMTIFQCNTCKEGWPLCKTPNDKSNYECVRCKRDKTRPKKFSIENDMIPSKVPLELQGLTQVEEMLIARAFPIIQVYTKPNGGQKAYKGHVLTLPHDVQHIANVLPRYPSDIPVIVFKIDGKDNRSRDLRVRRQKVLDALVWLTGKNSMGEPNNPRYQNVTIDRSRFDKLPEDDYLQMPMNVDFNQEEVEDDDLDNEGILPDFGPNSEDSEEKTYDCNTEMGSFIPIKVKTKKEKDIINDSILNPESVKIGNEPLNEFTTEYLATLAFPTLFPDGKGDPTNSSIRRSIAKSDTESFSEKIKHLIKFAEMIDGKWVYRFAAHPRFGFWAYNMLYRRRLLGQGSFYLKQNPGEANLTINELQDMVREGSHATIMKKLMRYAKNVTGTNAYWNQAKEELKATISQVGSPTIFWTLSCAEFHWPEYHALFSNDNDSSSDTLRENIINNPHLIDWFFTVRVENFVKLWLYETLGAEWHWYRFEYAVMRGSIHCHGVAKLKNDPGLCSLTQKALEGHIAEKELLDSEFEDNVRVELETKVNEGKAAEREVTEYVDSIVTACNPCTPEEGWVKPKVHPCKKKVEDIDENELDDDYANLVNSVQRHTKCSTAYCLRKKNDDEQYCRFNFPFEDCNETYIEFEELNSKKYGKQYRPKIVLKRNDSRVNRHQRLQLQSWRANCDIQPIIDYNACLEYLAKYASKAEKISDVARDAFVSVVENLKGTEQMRSVIQKLMIRAVGERDFSIQEVMHHILSLKLVSSSFQVVNVSVDGSRKVEINNEDVLTEASTVDNYANRANLEGCDAFVLDSNFMQFVSNYSVQKDVLKKRKKPVIVRAFPTPSFDPKGPNFYVFCKYQLLKYKPWRTRISDAWDGLSENDTDMFCQKWNEFLQTDLGQSVVPNWRREFNNAELYFERSETDEFEENVEGEREEWMHLADLCANNNEINQDEPSHNDLEYWQSCRNNYTEEQIGNMVSWLDKRKAEMSENPVEQVFELKVDSLNESQRKAFDILLDHDMNQRDQLFMMITGLAGSGKSYLINNIRALLKEKCIVSAYFGIAAFNINARFEIHVTNTIQ
ncbi:uncharacterized protein [Clytia hemisphaerica]|uniref:uncharacterized protein isoform X2 n=1 Tax=Clytia hemisphaerica TaxID=252671 RepID=UPI0034D6219D